LERFIARKPLRQVHECVFGVLALESEPVDPRLWTLDAVTQGVVMEWLDVGRREADKGQ